MNKKDNGIYTPFIIRTGLVYSYWRTLPILVILYGVGITSLLISGLFQVFLLEFLAIFISFMVILFAIWIVRDMISGFDGLFDIFDKETRQKTAICSCIARDLDREPKPSKKFLQKEISELFVTNESSIAFNEKVRGLIFNRKEIIFFLVGTLFFTIFWMLYFITPNAWKVQGLTAEPWTTIYLGFYYTAVILACIGAIPIFWLLFGYLRVPTLLGNSASKFKVWESIRCFHEEDEKDCTPVSYERFHRTTRIIGNFVNMVTFRLVLFLVIAIIAAIGRDLLQVGQILPNTWFFAIALTPFAIGLLVFPQFHIHSVLESVKEATLRIYEGQRANLETKFIFLQKQLERVQQREENHVKQISEIREDIKTLDSLIERTEKEGTWLSRLPTAVRFFGTSLVPAIIAAIVEAGIMILV